MQEEDKKAKNNTIQKTQKMSNRKMLDITIYKHTPKIIIQESSYKQLEVKTTEHRSYEEIVSDITARN
jgi:hypothetical protein